MLRLLVLAAFAAAVVSAQQPNDYGDARTWLCRPGQHDVCDADLTTTVVRAGGGLSRETWSADPKAQIDCFYVYPTVSTDMMPNSDMVPDEAERNVIRQQFARFASQCRPYAPMYRQVTLLGLRPLLAGRGGSLDHGIQYDDVRDAWNYYLAHDNQGRGFVLIGHSQGSYILTRLIREEIDGKPVEARMVSAIIPGATVPVARGKDTGGAFQHIPVCRAASQTGCVIAYSSFRATVPPPADTLFGKVVNPDLVAACTNPAALGGGEGELRAYLPVHGQNIVGNTPPKPWITPEKLIDTQWVSVPGMLTAKCTSNENATYLQVTIHADPSGRRVDEIGGDILANGKVQANWGLHLIDVNLAIGNFVDIVRQQSLAWVARGK